VLAIALAVVITVLVVRPADGGGGNGDPTQQNGDSEFASADDTGPVNIITEDPTCAAWGRTGREYADETKSVGWLDRDQSIAANQWTAEQRQMYEKAGAAMTRAAERTYSLAKQTPHRVMRELYLQFAEYVDRFVSEIPNYSQQDNKLADVTDAIGNALNNVCASINYKVAQPIAPLIQAPDLPAEIAPIESSNTFLNQRDPVCSEWASAVSDFSDKTIAWREIDANISAPDWTPEQRSINESVVSVMTSNADTLASLGARSNNAVLGDFATLAAQYRRGFAASIPTYKPNDNFLSESAVFLVQTVNFACEAVG
jgi:hypothetical protein